MGIFGSGIRLRDVVAGAAKSIDDQLKDDIKRTKTFDRERTHSTGT